MNSTTAEDIPSNYTLTNEIELEIGLKFLNRETAMLAGSVESAYGYKVSYKKVWLAKQKAITRIYGDWDYSYNQLRRYFNALQTFIPENTLDHDSVIFHQVFWSFPLCVEAFKHCKPLVSVDEIHLYGKYTGILLMGIAHDGNNNILSIAFVLVELENTDSWYFFLTNLKRHVATQPGILLISDRHAAITTALERDGCGWEHNFYCIRHIASNFATNFKSKEAKRHLVNAAYSKMQEQVQYYLELISGKDPATSLAMMAWIRELEPPK
ncbi:uncharacterized protein [Arachis hypogaea]|uniref:uncharacterized protein n=1 Tax=Arachis hypogaea TaxID=3818 RepID=UPI000DECF1CF|nr:uncharacterized protein LOC112795283 [Arachis hypogaea]